MTSNSTNGTNTANNPKRNIHLPVFLYIPNILGYLRIIFAFLGLYYAFLSPVLTIGLWIVCCAFDAIDGILARKLNQCSKFGILLDVASDNVLRSIAWISAIISSSLYYANEEQSFENGKCIWIALTASLIICLEWLTMLTTQIHAAVEGGKHWKKEREQDPLFVKIYFSNNFRNPIGILGIYGLFSSGMFTYGYYIPILNDNIPFFTFWQYASYLGRALSIPVELYLCYGYFRYVIEQEKQENQIEQKSNSENSHPKQK